MCLPVDGHIRRSKSKVAADKIRTFNLDVTPLHLITDNLDQSIK